MPSAKYRVFAPGQGYGIPGYVEVRQLPSAGEFLVAATREFATQIKELVEDPGNDLCEVVGVQGLPRGWILVLSRSGAARGPVAEALPDMKVSRGVRFSLRGGLRSGEGFTFFRFAPPIVMVESEDELEGVFCDGVRLERDKLSGGYLLSRDLQPEKRLVIEVRCDGEAVRALSIFLTDLLDWNLKSGSTVLDSFGVATAHAVEPDPPSEGVTGVLGGVPGAMFSLPNGLPAGRRLLLLGRRPGEAARWPSEPYPEWHVVWSIELRRRGHAEFCGIRPEEPISQRAEGASRDRVDLWKDVLWHSRKRIIPPSHPLLRDLWVRYSEVAKNV
jgi:hypothetical protein